MRGTRAKQLRKIANQPITQNGKTRLPHIRSYKILKKAYKDDPDIRKALQEAIRVAYA